jgi:hypothetical protein
MGRMLPLGPFPRQVVLHLTTLLLHPHLDSLISSPPLHPSTPTINTPLLIPIKIQTGARIRARKARQLRSGKRPRPSSLPNLLNCERREGGDPNMVIITPVGPNQRGSKVGRRKRRTNGRARRAFSLGHRIHVVTGLATTLGIHADRAIGRPEPWHYGRHARFLVAGSDYILGFALLLDIRF